MDGVVLHLYLVYSYLGSFNSFVSVYVPFGNLIYFMLRNVVRICAQITPAYNTQHATNGQQQTTISLKATKGKHQTRTHAARLGVGMMGRAACA